jgi:hypothetical protein
VQAEFDAEMGLSDGGWPENNDEIGEASRLAPGANVREAPGFLKGRVLLRRWRGDTISDRMWGVRMVPAPRSILTMHFAELQIDRDLEWFNGSSKS